MLKAPIGYSKALMEKFGDVVFPELSRRRRTRKEFYKLHSKDGFFTDVNSFLNAQKNNQLVRDVVENEEWHKIDDPDALVHLILKWVKWNIKYKRDIEVYGQPEYWQTSEETLQKGTGDCEDGAILILTLAFWSGVPMDRIDLTWGEVVGGGHAYVVYVREDGVR